MQLLLATPRGRASHPRADVVRVVRASDEPRLRGRRSARRFRRGVPRAPLDAVDAGRAARDGLGHARRRRRVLRRVQHAARHLVEAARDAPLPALQASGARPRGASARRSVAGAVVEDRDRWHLARVPPRVGRRLDGDHRGLRGLRRADVRRRSRRRSARAVARSRGSTETSADPPKHRKRRLPTRTPRAANRSAACSSACASTETAKIARTT